MLYLVYINGYLDSYGADMQILGLFTSMDEAKIACDTVLNEWKDDDLFSRWSEQNLKDDRIYSAYETMDPESIRYQNLFIIMPITVNQTYNLCLSGMSLYDANKYRYELLDGTIDYTGSTAKNKHIGGYIE